MGIATGAMGGGGLMSLGGELMGLGLSMDQIQTVGQGSVRLRARSRGRRDGRRNRGLHSRGCRSSSDGVTALVTEATVSRLGPRPTGERPPRRRSKGRASTSCLAHRRRPPHRARSIARRTARAPLRAGRPWRVIARARPSRRRRSQRPGARGSRQRRGRTAGRLRRRDRRLWLWAQTSRPGHAAARLRRRAVRRRSLLRT